MADALYARALAEPAKLQALLAEAAAVPASLPPTMKGWKPLDRLREDIADAR